jgi:hypothetical protein
MKGKMNHDVFHHVHATAFCQIHTDQASGFRVPPLRNSTRTTRTPPLPATSPRVQQPLAHDGFSLFAHAYTKPSPRSPTSPRTSPPCWRWLFLCWDIAALSAPMTRGARAMLASFATISCGQILREPQRVANSAVIRVSLHRGG